MSHGLQLGDTCWQPPESQYGRFIDISFHTPVCLNNAFLVFGRFDYDRVGVLMVGAMAIYIGETVQVCSISRRAFDRYQKSKKKVNVDPE